MPASGPGDDFTPDLALLRREKGTDAEQEAEWRRTVQALDPLVRAGLVGRTTGAEIDVVASDTWRKVIRGIDGYRGEAPLAHWVATVAASALADVRRKAARRRSPAGDRVAGDVPPASSDVEDVPDHDDERIIRTLALRDAARLLAPVMHRLSDRDRRMVVLFALQELSHREVAAELGLSSDRASQRLWKKVRARFHAAWRAVWPNIDLRAYLSV